ncbi:MAG: threonine--tRNA ligase [Candidatus Lloydbacteria bacterium RIFCSPHIGHO2_01_FULL_49_22]|uniref:Threonine--tRNA ligase n=1 Tax=Candidatus Lloydbacteria bacterium RIFCSPHIGHO2_01_FULL_49_22 TaxID=1798658 RepID=A0A1G2CX09_9BACT|nr:MAG: threonine--tRNA ligase [Candidatus Lloydbacteria bacterium RIFCSPHIGHO2_01_FULL_49_22]OGZ09047.1 MAG: threonine--tRNA ligase [Candidatus Lloydbacteria bacterium RIFCSPHIGHO2_02_FULL_50_18]
MDNGEKLHNIRHTFAHLLAMAAIEFDPNVKLGIGPVTDDGFYYDLAFTKTPTPEDLKGFEKSMRKFINQKLPMTGKEISLAEGQKLFAAQPFKLELLEQYAGEDKALTAYTLGDFTDLCKGGHVKDTSEVDAGAFALTRIAGAYWRGDQKNAMLTRIYGYAFETKVELNAYETMLEEAKKRDHRKLGKELGLFVFSDLVGAGLPLWTPKGTILRELLNDYVWSMRKKKGYQKVTIPHITKKELYQTSGHWAKYADDLFKITTREDREYAMKPMNCPHHTQIFDAFPKSYRDMPQRYAETTMVYRDEQSGELSGLSRVLAITQDDAHVFCREIQIEEEIFAIWDIIDQFYGTFGFTNLQVRFSRHDPEHFDKYLGTTDVWKKAEDAILSLMKKRGVEKYIDGKGEAAIYGPKIDFIAKDSIGRTQQIATIQLDFNQPKNFNLTCTNEKGEKETVVMIHCAIMGSIERFLSVIIEHLAGNFPLWLSPTQVAIVPITEAHHAFAKEVAAMLEAKDIRVSLALESESLGKKIRAAKVEKTPYTLVIGDAEVAGRKVTLESRNEGKVGECTLDELLAKLTEEIRLKK